MNRVCAWCGRELGLSERREGAPVTHGVCPPCRHEFFTSPKAKEVEAGQERPNGLAGLVCPGANHFPQCRGTDMNEQTYPEYHKHLRHRLAQLGKELPGPMGGFGQLHKAAVADGALSVKTKELIALAIAVHARCEGCIAFHTRDAVRAGANRQEVLEAVGVAVLMGGGPATMYACEALEALEQFQADAGAKS